MKTRSFKKVLSKKPSNNLPMSKREKRKLLKEDDTAVDEFTAIDKDLEWCKEHYNEWLKRKYLPVIKKARKKYKISVPYNFVPRWYQISTVEAMLTMRFVVFCMHRRSGKDYMSVSMLLHKAMERVGNYYYLFPKAKQGRKIIWEGLDNDGKRFRDHIPEYLIKVNPRSREHMINNTEMMITLINGSTIQIVGSDNYDNTIVGTNVAGIIFSEFSISDPLAWGYCRPIVAANQGWTWFNGTPRGKNHFWKILDGAMNNNLLKDLWYGIIVKNSETGVVSQEEIELMRAEGMSEQMIQQEMECAFDGILDGVIYSKQIIYAREHNHFAVFNHDVKKPVYMGFDIGNDMIACVFFQILNDCPTVIDFFGCKNAGINYAREEIVRIANEEDYNLALIILPHDGDFRNVNNYDENGRTLTTRDTFETEFNNLLSMGVTVLDRSQSIVADIEVVRSRFYKWRFNTGSNAQSIRKKERLEYFYNAMGTYAYPDESRGGGLATKPIHNWASHPMDAFRSCVFGHASGLTRDNFSSWLIDVDKAVEEEGYIDTYVVENNLI